MDGKKNIIIQFHIKSIHAERNKCLKFSRPECPFYHSKEERRNLKEMNSQILRSYNITQSSPIYKEKAAMQYYPAPYQPMQHQYYSPPAALLQCYPQVQSPFKSIDKKPKSKLSTKSPHAIAGHKLNRKNTDYTPGNLSREPMTNANNFVNSPGSYQPNDNFSKASNLIGTQTYFPTEIDDYENFYESDHSMALTRKMTFDVTENAHAAPLESSSQSIEEMNMQMKIVSSFKLNPFSFEGDSFNDSDYFSFDCGAQTKHLSKQFDEAKNEDQFNLFEPFSEDTFQSEEIPLPSSGPILSLMSQADQPGIQN